MDKRTAFERNIFNNFFKLKIGCLNKNDLKAFYTEGSTYITPTINDDYNDFFKQLARCVKSDIHTLFSSDLCCFDNDSFIFDLDVAAGGIKAGKKSNMTFQLFFTTRDGKPVPMEEVMSLFRNHSGIILDKMRGMLEEKGFSLSKTK